MGLLQAGIGALTGVLSDQWREYFYCDSMPSDVLVTKGAKRVSGRSSNTKASENIITNGSIIAVNEGQCMMIVEQGVIVEFCAEAGEFVWDNSTEPTIFYGGFEQGIKNSWETLKKRFTMGGDPGKDQRVYFFNTKEIMGNKYGTANPVPFRVVDQNIGLDMDIAIKCFGEYSYRVTDPMLFYKNVCGNVQTDYTRDKIDSQLKSELLTALQPAFAKTRRAYSVWALSNRPSSRPSRRRPKHSPPGAGPVPAARSTQASSAWSARSPSRRTRQAGPAPSAARSTRGNSARNAPRQSRRAYRNTSAISAAGSPKPARSRLSSARNVPTRLTTGI